MLIEEGNSSLNSGLEVYIVKEFLDYLVSGLILFNCEFGRRQWIVVPVVLVVNVLIRSDVNSNFLT